MSEIYQRMSIGERIRYLIEVREYKQVELAKKCGITQAAISNLVTDNTRKPSAPTLLKLAAALGANPDWIITGEGDPWEIGPTSDKAETDLLDSFRHMDAGAQNALLAAAKAMRK